jgi:hypothetical protein
MSKVSRIYARFRPSPNTVCDPKRECAGVSDLTNKEGILAAFRPGPFTLPLLAFFYICGLTIRLPEGVVGIEVMFWVETMAFRRV